jgi:L-lactate dehydrogenase complex protein LldG
MSSREKILSTVEGNQPPMRELPPLPSGTPGASGAGGASGAVGDLSLQFIAVLESIGGAAYIVSGFARVATILHEQFAGAGRVISGCPELASFAGVVNGNEDPHTLEDVDLAILPAHFGVAENGACWITETQMLHRALPFITQHLALIIHRRDVVADMHEAYDRIAALESAATAGVPATAATAGNPASPDDPKAAAAAAPYGFATFIAGPSKTADIEQSLVLGAHGPMSLTVFLLDEQLSDAGFY